MNIDDYMTASDDSTQAAAMSPAARVGALADQHYEKERADDRARARRRMARDDGTADLIAFREKWQSHLAAGATQFAGLFRWVELTSQLLEERIEITNRIVAEGGAPIVGILSEQVEAVYAAALAAGAVEAGICGDAFDDGTSALHEGRRVLEETILLSVRAAMRRAARAQSVVRQIREQAESV